MHLTIRKLPLVGLLISALILAWSATASAHVVVRPAEAVTAGYQTFTVSVPNEKTIPTVAVSLSIPSSIQSVTPTQKAGWEINVERETEDEASAVTSIAWSGGSIGVGLRDEFTFSAKLPEQATELRWNAYQTYADGTVVAWDQESNGGHGDTDNNSGPFSVTKVVTETAATTNAQKTEEAAAHAKNTANRALYVAIAGVVLGLVGIAVATRKK